MEKVDASNHLRLAMETKEEREQDWRILPYMHINNSVDICV